MFSTKWFDGCEDFEDVRKVRIPVFCDEQGVPEELVFDLEDKNAMVVVVYDNGSPVATGRVIKDGDKMLLGRIAVLKQFRGMKYGDLVVRMLIRKCYDSGFKKQYVHAQLQARGFYERLGFTAFGQDFLESGIPHINMVHEGDVAVC